MLCDAVQNYISSVKGLPFFYVIGDETYHQTLDELCQKGFSVVRISDYCPKPDKYPNIDDLIDYFRTSDIDYRENKSVVVGLGEYLALRGEEESVRELKRLKSTTLGNARVVLLLRGVSKQAQMVIEDDNKMQDQQRAYISSDHTCSLSVVNIATQAKLDLSKGIKGLLHELEEGGTGVYKCTSQLDFNKSLIPVTTLPTSYSILRYECKEFLLPECLGDGEQWERFLTEYLNNNRVIEKVFAKNGIDENYLDKFVSLISGFEYQNWLFFVYLKLNYTDIQNSYLRFVVYETSDFNKFKYNFLVAITTISHNDIRFLQYYADRKVLCKDFDESDIAIFVHANDVDPKESIYHLTDNTLLERKQVLQWISHNGLNDSISTVYPDLADYLAPFSFNCGDFGCKLTEYFKQYRFLKVTNALSEQFLSLVDEYAKGAKYAKLPTRDSAIKDIQDPKSSYLYWIDALGIEYVPYITAVAKKKGLSMKVAIVRSDLPTITSVNKSFFDNWPGRMKYKEEALDDIKHHDKGGYYFRDDEGAIHLPAELMVIKKAIERAATELAMHKCKSFVIASDHGASRLAVLKKQEVKYETDTRGEHSGRCCKTFDGCDLDNAVEENGYIVLKDYGRFKGSRTANVEVHGGASLEEIIVPVITLTLKRPGEVNIVVINKDDIVLNKHIATVELYVSEVQNGKLSVVCNGTRYYASAKDSTHYSVVMDDIKRAKTYQADVFDGDDLIGHITLPIKGKTGTSSGFDDWFN